MKILASILIFINSFYFQSNCYSQVSMEFNQANGQLSISPNPKWRVGKSLQITIKNCPSSGNRYEISYSSTENINTTGFQLFSKLNSGIPKSGVTTCPDQTLTFRIENKDYSVITITQFGTSNAAINTKSYTYQVTGGIKFDVSSGAFYTNMYDESYILKKVDDTTNQILREISGSFRIGTGILAHLHTRWNTLINLSVSSGFEINNDAKIGYLAGVSLIFGKERKFFITFGEAFSKKNVLSNAYVENELVSDELTIVPVVSIWDNNWFCSVTYNF
ncbi:MAG TPA: hypothetical protein VFG10_09305 [Saprospiraceae bacterium]|nr:hypothetical protein [Saprospiraceae bacterium]